MADNKEDLEEQMKQLAIKVCELRGLDPFEKVEVERWYLMSNEVIQFLGAEPLHQETEQLQINEDGLLTAIEPKKLDS